MLYFWLDSADLAVSRVAERVSMGGHNIPEVTVRQRYHRSIQNFFLLYRPIINTWRVFDNSQRGTSRVVAEGEGTSLETILMEPSWQLMKQELPS